MRSTSGSDHLNQGWPTFHLPCANFLLNGFRCATISINPGASISLPCRVCLQKQRFVRGCKLHVITTRLQCATSNHAMRHSLATPDLNNAMFASIHPKLMDQMDLKAITNEFVKVYETRMHYYGFP